MPLPMETPTSWPGAGSAAAETVAPRATGVCERQCRRRIAGRAGSGGASGVSNEVSAIAGALGSAAVAPNASIARRR